MGYIDIFTACLSNAVEQNQPPRSFLKASIFEEPFGLVKNEDREPFLNFVDPAIIYICLDEKWNDDIKWNQKDEIIS